MARVSRDSLLRASQLLSRPRSSKNPASKYSSEAAAVSPAAEAKDYEEYRRALYGGITHKAVLVDAVGTLFVPSQPMAQVKSRCCIDLFLSVLGLGFVSCDLGFCGCLDLQANWGEVWG